LRGGDELAEQFGVARDEGDAGFAGNDVLRFQHAEQRAGDVRVLRDLFQRQSHDLRAHGGGLGKLDGGLLFGGAGDDVHLVGAVLLDGGGDLPQPVHDLFLDLLDHAGVAEVHFADIDGAEAVTPFLRERRDFLAHGQAHGMPVLQHVGELHVAEAADGGVAHVGGQRTARVGVLEQVGHGVAHDHLIPDADAHGRAFLGIDGGAADILLIQPQVEGVAFAEEVHERRLEAELEDEQVQPRLVNDGHDLAEEHIDLARPFLDDGVKAEQPHEAEERRHENEHGDERDDGRDEDVGKWIIHDSPP